MNYGQPMLTPAPAFATYGSSVHDGQCAYTGQMDAPYGLHSNQAAATPSCSMPQLPPTAQSYMQSQYAQGLPLMKKRVAGDDAAGEPSAKKKK